MTAQGPGEAVSNANSYTTYEQGMCLAWVRGPCWEIGGLYASAIDAWNGARYKHPGDRNPPKGAPCFYRGGQYGHIVIFKDDQMRSTDCPSSGRVGNAALSWPETNWGQEYLGWTEDLNGVMLPGLVKDNGEDEDMPEYDHAKTTAEQTLTADEWTPIDWGKVVSGDAFTAGNPGGAFSKAKYSATLNIAVQVEPGESVTVQTIEWTSEGGAVEENVTSKHDAASGYVRTTVALQGSVGEGRRLRFRLKPSAAAVLKSADVVVLSWGRA